MKPIVPLLLGLSTSMPGAVTIAKAQMPAPWESPAPTPRYVLPEGLPSQRYRTTMIGGGLVAAGVSEPTPTAGLQFFGFTTPVATTLHQDLRLTPQGVQWTRVGGMAGVGGGSAPSVGGSTPSPVLYLRVSYDQTVIHGASEENALVESTPWAEPRCSPLWGWNVGVTAETPLRLPNGTRFSPSLPATMALRGGFLLGYLCQVPSLGRLQHHANPRANRSGLVAYFTIHAGFFADGGRWITPGPGGMASGGVGGGRLSAQSTFLLPGRWILRGELGGQIGAAISAGRPLLVTYAVFGEAQGDFYLSRPGVNNSIYLGPTFNYTHHLESTTSRTPSSGTTASSTVQGDQLTVGIHAGGTIP